MPDLSLHAADSCHTIGEHLSRGRLLTQFSSEIPPFRESQEVVLEVIRFHEIVRRQRLRGQVQRLDQVRRDDDDQLRFVFFERPTPE